MSRSARPTLAITAAAAALLLAACASTPTNPMSFFVTSAGPGKGADLGGLAGADAHCDKLAAAVGAGGKGWRAYLSATPADGKPAVNARDRIGAGPWRNAKGEVIASDVEQLHGKQNNLTKMTAVTEKGEVVSGRGDPVNMHDVLTGSSPEGRAVVAPNDTTCGNWTKSGEGSAIVGHHDRMGLNDSDAAKSWNSSHGSRGCGLDALKATGGNGYFYCFATK
jgi:hypothetical protein